MSGEEVTKVSNGFDHDYGNGSSGSELSEMRAEMRLLTDAVKSLAADIRTLNDNQRIRGETITYRGLTYFVTILIIAITGIKGSDVLLELVRRSLGQ